MKKILFTCVFSSILGQFNLLPVLAQTQSNQDYLLLPTLIAQSNSSNIATIFRPILNQIQGQLRGNEVIRLPSSLYSFQYEGMVAEVIRDQNKLTIDFDSEANCQYLYCEFVGNITTRFQQVPLNEVFLYNDDSPQVYNAPITLKEGVRGIYHYSSYTNVRPGPTMEIAWHQDGQTYVVSFNQIPSDSVNAKKEALINIARSMANQPQISSSSSQSNQSTPTPLTSQTRLTLHGFGPVQIGMTISQAQQVTGQRFNQIESGGEPSCLYYETNGVEKVSFMVTEGKISRIDVDNPNVRTPSGARIGLTERQIYELYPGYIRSEPHHYLEVGHYLYFVPRDAEEQNYRLIFETDGQKVITIRSGKLPEVSWIEGCA